MAIERVNRFGVLISVIKLRAFDVFFDYPTP
jgi:hypothetical protein